MARVRVRIAQKARSKYRAVPTEVDGVRFASKAEARRYGELSLLVKARKIRQLELQPEFPIVVNGVKVAKYVADFRYQTIPWDYEGIETVVEDVKGMKTPVYRLKKKLVEAQYGITIREIR
jgi:hypothetical protein